MTDYTRVDAARPWAPAISYSRAVRRGDLIEVGGTSSTSPVGDVLHPDDAYAQTKYVLEVIVAAIEELGGQASDVVRTRAYLTRIEDWAEVGKAHGETFAGISPASTFVEVSRLMLPQLVVEVEATALLLPKGARDE